MNTPHHSKPTQQLRIRLLEEKINQLQKLNLKLKKELMLDPLTKVYNRRALNKILKTQVNKANTSFHQTFSCIMIDIDYFKKINDHYGHLIGDLVLFHLAQILQKNIRQSDWLHRYGGEEFVLILPATTAEEAQKIATRLFHKVSEQLNKLPQLNMIQNSITLSMGITQFIPNESMTQLFHRLDSALYQAKNRGRNQMIWAEKNQQKVKFLPLPQELSLHTPKMAL